MRAMPLTPFLARCILALTLLFAPAPLLAAATLGCAEFVPATVEVKAVFEDVTYETAHPMLKIRDMSEDAANGSQSESWPVGLAVGQFFMNVVKDVYKIRSATDPSTCGQIKAIHIEMGFMNNKIYVAKEFPKRSCPYKTVLAHEELHKEVDRQLLEEYAAKARTYFADAAAGVGMVRSGSGSAIEAQIGEHMDRAMDSFSNEMESERKRRQKEVDSNEEYARVSAACEGNLMQIVSDRIGVLESSYPGLLKTPESVKKKEADAAKRDMKTARPPRE